MAIPIAIYAKTYPIVEKDLVQEMIERKPLVEKNAKKYINEVKEKTESFSGEDTVKARKNYTYYVDMTYTVPQDIPKINRYGKYEGILYAKGTKINPIKYLKAIPPDMVVFNPCDKDESRLIQNLRKTKYKNKHFMIVATMCKSKDLMKDSLGQHAYILTSEVKDKFKIKETVSIISVDKQQEKVKVEVLNAKEFK